MKTTTNLALACLTSSLLLVSCGGGNKEKSSDANTDTQSNVEAPVATTETYDLTAQGIPTKIIGPAGATIGKGMSGMEIDGVTTTSLLISKGKFKLEVNMDSEASGRDLAGLIDYYKDLDSTDDGFEMIKEEANGYIYKSVFEGEVDYGIRYIKMNDKGEAVEMCSGFMIDSYKIEDAEALFEAAKTATWE